jgi:hypothetical protein
MARQDDDQSRRYGRLRLPSSSTRRGRAAERGWKAATIDAGVEDQHLPSGTRWLQVNRQVDRSLTRLEATHLGDLALVVEPQTARCGDRRAVRELVLVDGDEELARGNGADRVMREPARVPSLLESFDDVVAVVAQVSRSPVECAVVGEQFAEACEVAVVEALDRSEVLRRVTGLGGTRRGDGVLRIGFASPA